MRILVIIIVLIVAFVTAKAVEDVVEYLRAHSTGSAVVLDWRTGTEDAIVHYEVERAGEDQIFRYVATVSAKGSHATYQFTDEEAFGKDENGNAVAATYFTYRLKIVYDQLPATYSTTAGVSHNVSTVRRTWGMIKEMFR